jgi:hypothetical protein
MINLVMRIATKSFVMNQFTTVVTSGEGEGLTGREEIRWAWDYEWAVDVDWGN